MFIPIGTDRPQRRIPWMNYAIIAANVIIYLGSHTTSAHARFPGDPVSTLSAWTTPYLLYPTHLQLYQFITYQFLHENPSHILFNMLFLYVFGNNLNEKLGNIGYLAFYLTGGILAGCGQVLTSSAPTLGASGSISAVTGLYLVLLPRTNIKIFLWFIYYVDVYLIPSLYFILFSVLKDFLEPLFWGNTQTAHAAHIAGNLAGFSIGLLLLGARLTQRDHYDLLALLDRYRRRKQYENLVAGGYDPFTPTSFLHPKSDHQQSALDPRIVSLREEIATLLRNQHLDMAAQKYLELRALDATQLLASQDQLDVANQLMTSNRYHEAAAAYEDFLRVYTSSHQRDQITLVLAVLYARYLHNPARAADLFRAAIPRLHDQSQKKWAEEELAGLTPVPPPPSTK